MAFTAYGGGSTAPLTVSGTSAGALALNGAPITVTTTSALAVGTYTLIAKGGSATGVSGTPGTLTINGSGLAAGTSGALSVSSGSLILTVTSTTFNTTYNSNTATSGTVPTDNTAYSSGATVTVLGNTGSLAKTGYTFAGWNTAANGSGTDYNPEATFNIAANTTLYAQWTPNNNTVTFDGNGATSGSMSGQTIATDASANLNSNLFEKTGYTFAGWATTAGGAVAYANQASFTMGTSDVTLYAKWIPNNNTITFDGNGATGGSMSTQTIATDASANLNSNAFTRTGYVFKEWNSNSDGTGTAYANGANYTMGTSDVTLFAIWDEVTTPTINVSGTLSGLSTTYGTVSGSASFTVSGAALTHNITITPPAGFEVSTTSGGESGFATSQTLIQSGGNVAITTVYVRLAATSVANSYSGNIVVSSNTLNETISIPTSTVNPYTLTISGLGGENKVYDGTTAANLNGTPTLSATVNSDLITLTGTAVATFIDANVANNKTINISGFSLSGTNSSSYALIAPTTTANITTAALTITGISISDKVYNGNTAATITGTAEYVGLVNAETFSVTGTPIAVFADANVNTNISVTVSGYTAPSANYSIIQPTGLTANIIKANQTISGLAATDSKTTTTSTFTISSVIASSGLTVSFSSSNTNVATISGTTVTIVGAGTTTITATQAGNGNYNAATPVEQLLTVTQATNASDYFRTKATGNWNNTATWESSSDNENWISATATPTSSANTITILNGHTVTVTESVTADQLTVNAGGKIIVNTSQTLTIANGDDSFDMIVFGNVENSGTITSTGAVKFENGGYYKHTRNGGSMIIASWHENSTCEITGVTSTSPTNLSQSFGNFIWNNTNQSSWLDLSLTSSFSVAGDYTINSTGGGTFGINMATATSNRTYNIAGNMIINSSKVTLANNTGIATLNIGGDLIMNNSNLNQIDLGHGNRNPSGDYRSLIYLTGDMVIGTGSIVTCTDYNVNDDYGKIIFNKAGSQHVEINGTLSWIDFDVNSGSTLILNSNINLGLNQTSTKYSQFLVNNGGVLDFNGFNITDNNTGEGVFEVLNGGTINITSSNGITYNGNAGNVLVGYPTYNEGSNYIYKGLVSQITGDGLPTTVNNLTIDNAAGVTITNNAQTVSGSLTVNSEKRLIVAAGKKLTVNGTANNNGVITLAANAANGTATLKGDIGGNADVEVHLPAASTRTWWYLASPVTGAASSVFGSNKVGDYSETTRSYSNPFAAPTTLTAGKGYVVKMTATEAANYAFENKTLNTGDISVLLTRTVTETADNAKRGFNLVGNPYPSYLNWDMAYNASTNLRPTIWYRTLNGASMEFHTYNAAIGASVPSSANGYIPPMQAFWVKVDKDPTVGSVSNVTLNFTNDMRSHDLSALGNPLKAPAADRQLVRLSISNGTLSDETVIATHPSASDSYDRFDSEKMANGDTNRPEIFSMAGNQELVINGISPLTDSKQIALGVRPGLAGNYTIALTEWRNTSDMDIVLRDNQLGEELLLTESNNYSFSTDGNTSKSRFSLLFRAKESTTGFDRISSDLMIYTTAQSIRMESESLEGNNVSVHNALGQPVFSGKAQSNRLEINGLTPAVYMVKVNNQTKMVIVK